MLNTRAKALSDLKRKKKRVSLLQESSSIFSVKEERLLATSRLVVVQVNRSNVCRQGRFLGERSTTYLAAERLQLEMDISDVSGPPTLQVERFRAILAGKTRNFAVFLIP